MHPTISYYLATARAAELRSQAQRGALARAARHARTHKLEHAAPRLAAAGRRLHAPNAKGNFCFEATLGYRRVERGR